METTSLTGCCRLLARLCTLSVSVPNTPTWCSRGPNARLTCDSTWSSPQGIRDWPCIEAADRRRMCLPSLPGAVIIQLSRETRSLSSSGQIVPSSNGSGNVWAIHASLCFAIATAFLTIVPACESATRPKTTVPAAWNKYPGHLTEQRDSLSLPSGPSLPVAGVILPSPA